MVPDNNEKAQHEGQSLIKLVTDAGRSRAELAQAANVTQSAVYRWSVTPRFADPMWRTIAHGLRGINIDPRTLRNDEIASAYAPSPRGEQQEIEGEELVRLGEEILDAGGFDELMRWKRIVEAPAAQRHALGFWLRAVERLHGKK